MESAQLAQSIPSTFQFTCATLPDSILMMLLMYKNNTSAALFRWKYPQPASVLFRSCLPVGLQAPQDYFCVKFVMDQPEMEFSLGDLPAQAALLLRQYGHARVFAFHGELGAGKTTFIQALCRQLGVRGHVSSPTFSITNEYTGNDGPVYHLDLYRLKDEEEAVRAGVEETLYSGATCFAEWPERAPGIFPEHTVHVYLVEAGDTTRRMRVDNK